MYASFYLISYLNGDKKDLTILCRAIEFLEPKLGFVPF